MRVVFTLTLLAMICSPAVLASDDFLSKPELLKPDPRFGGDMIYMHKDFEARTSDYTSVMVDEPVIFMSPDSPYGGFKASDMAAVVKMVRESFIEGLESEPVAFGNFSAVEEPGAGTLYLRIALKNLYIRKNKRSIFGYTPIGATMKGVKDMASEAIDKSTLVELSLEAEVLDSVSGEVLFAVIADRGQRKDKRADIEEAAATWGLTGAIATVMGRRMACRLDNGGQPEDQKRDCFKEIQLPGTPSK